MHRKGLSFPTHPMTHWVGYDFAVMFPWVEFWQIQIFKILFPISNTSLVYTINTHNTCLVNRCDPRESNWSDPEKIN